MDAKKEPKNDGVAKSSNRRVQFNVGGQMFEISHDVVLRHPNTMLAKSVSDTWLSDPTVIFIDGDGERFRHILDYLRSGSIILPMGLPKAAILNDLDYYGFENVNPDDIDASSATFEALAHFRMKKEEKKNSVKEIEEKMAMLRCEKTYRIVAHELCKKYVGDATNGLVFDWNTPDYSSDDVQFAFQSNFKEELFNSCLEDYGFYLISVTMSTYDWQRFFATVSFGVLSEPSEGP